MQEAKPKTKTAAEITAAFRAEWNGSKVMVGEVAGQVTRCLADGVLRVRLATGKCVDIKPDKLTRKGA